MLEVPQVPQKQLQLFEALLHLSRQNNHFAVVIEWLLTNERRIQGINRESKEAAEIHQNQGALQTINDIKEKMASAREMIDKLRIKV